MAIKGLEIRDISATGYAALGIRDVPRVAKLIDVSTCIGCKACEVACLEWNDLPVDETYTSTGSYQTIPELAYNFWNLIQFNELDDGNKFLWTMAKYQCMHCENPGCLRACPAPGAIVQYTNGIVDFVQENCIGCRFCVTGCPFNVPRVSPKSQKVYKCTLCSDRVAAGLEPACIKACPTGCLQFGTKERLLEFARRRVRQLRLQGFEQASIYDPPGVMGTHVIYVLPYGNRPEAYGLPPAPRVPATVSLWKGPLKTIGSTIMLGGVATALLHYMMYGPMEVESEAVTKKAKTIKKTTKKTTKKTSKK
ncbi:MAG: formate dehydrogenase subunit beta [Candidatus Brocadiales bacterium]